MKKKVLFVIDSLSCGGAEKSLVSLLNLIDYDRYEIDLQLYNPNGMFKNLVPKEVNFLPNLSYYDFINLSFLKQISTFNIKNIISKLKFSYFIRNNKDKIHEAQLFWKYCGKTIDNLNKEYDVAIAYNQGFSTYFVSEKVQAKKKFAWVNTDYIKAGYDENIDRKYYEKFDNIVAVSEGAKNVLKTCFAEFKQKILIINDINNASLINKMSEEENELMKIDEDTIKIVTVGRLVKLKGYDLAIEACKILNKKNIKFKWYVLGDGIERSNIENSIIKYGLQEVFILIGAVDNPYPYIANADIYVQTSRFEGFGLAIAEAKILNIPIVSTNFDVVYNQITYGKNGLIANMNGEDISRAIIEIIQNKKLKHTIIKNLKNEKKGNNEEINKFYQLIN